VIDVVTFATFGGIAVTRAGTKEFAGSGERRKRLQKISMTDVSTRRG
jgi:hypothetical protein